MAIRVLCDCGQKIVAGDYLARKKIRCPQCHQLIRLPQPDQEIVRPLAWSGTSDNGIELSEETLSLLARPATESTKYGSDSSTIYPKSDERSIWRMLSESVPIPMWALLGFPPVLIALAAIYAILVNYSVAPAQGAQPQNLVQTPSVRALPKWPSFGIKPVEFENQLQEFFKFKDLEVGIRLADVGHYTLAYRQNFGEVDRVLFSLQKPKNELVMSLLVIKILEVICPDNDETVAASLWMIFARDMRGAEQQLIQPLDFIPQECELVAHFKHLRIRCHPINGDQYHFVIEPADAPFEKNRN